MPDNLYNFGSNEDIRIALHNDIYLFAKILFGNKEYPMHYHLRQKSPEFHRNIIDRLINLKAGDKLGCAAPRDHAKTTLIDLIFPLWLILTGRLHFLLMVSESETQSIYNLETLGNEIEFNPVLLSIYGNRIGPTWGKEVKEFIGGWDKNGNPWHCKVQTRGTNQKVRGLKYGPYRPSCIVDDGEGEANALTELARDKFRRWINAQVIPGCHDGWVAFIGTIIDEESYLNRIVGPKAYDKNGNYKIKGWIPLFYQGVLQDTELGEFVAEGKEIVGKDGVPEVLWKDRRPYSFFKNERDRLESEGDLAYYFQEYQNIPRDDSFRIFKKKDLRYWDGYTEDRNGQKFIILHTEDGTMRKPVNTFMGVDPASSENVKSDFTVIMPIHVDSEFNIYVDDYFRGQVTPMNGADELWALMESHNPKSVNIEQTGHVMLADYLLRKSKLTGKFFPINPKDAVKNKFFRLMGMQPKFAVHAVFIKENHAELEFELLNFRKHGSFKKDTLDALYWAMDEIYVPEMEQKNDEWLPKMQVKGYDWQTGQLIYGES